MVSKKIIVSITDVDTGEVLGCVNYFNHNLKSIMPLPKAKEIASSWFNSFLRGLDSDKHNLYLSITIKDADSSQLSFKELTHLPK